MEIPWRQLAPDTLNALIDEFVSRDGTDYGIQEVSQQTKISQVVELLNRGKVKIIFDPETESTDIREVLEPHKKKSEENE